MPAYRKIRLWRITGRRVIVKRFYGAEGNIDPYAFGVRVFVFKDKMLLKINGKSEDIKANLTLAELILAKGLCAEKVVIEYNLRIVLKDKWENTYLQENDRVEIVSFVAGG